MLVKKLLDEFSEDVIRAFVQKNADYYLMKWKSMANSGSKISWNWASFLLGGFWMVYRKMFLYFFIVFIVGLIIGFIPLLNIILGLAMWIAFGLLGNYGYAYFVYNKLNELKILAKNEDELRQLALQKGGTSVLAAVILFVILFGLEILFIIFMTLAGISGGTSNYY